MCITLFQMLVFGCLVYFKSLKLPKTDILKIFLTRLRPLTPCWESTEMQISTQIQFYSKKNDKKREFFHQNMQDCSPNVTTNIVKGVAKCFILIVMRSTLIIPNAGFRVIYFYYFLQNLDLWPTGKRITEFTYPCKRHFL